MKAIIIHADDAGLSKGANDAILELMQKEIAHSTAVMAMCDGAREFIRQARGDVGLHVCLEPDQLFKGQAVVYKEIQRQWDHMVSLGAVPTHVDSHAAMLFYDLDALKAYVQFCQDHRVPPLLVKETRAEKLRQIIPVDRIIDFVTQQKGFKLDDLWILPDTPSYETKLAALDFILHSLEAGVTQLIVHPDLDTDQGRWEYEALKTRASYIKSLQGYNWQMAAGKLLL